MNDFMKWCFKVGFSAIVWVFILSISWNGRTMFSYAHANIVDNVVVHTIDEQLGELWYKVSSAAKTAVKGEPELTQPSDKKS